MIEKTFLPMRRVFSDATGKAALESSYPLREREIRSHANEEVRMIWHKNVAPDANPTRDALFAELAERIELFRLLIEAFDRGY